VLGVFTTLKVKKGPSSFICLGICKIKKREKRIQFNPLNADLNPICHLLALLGANRILQVSKIRVKRIYMYRGKFQDQPFVTEYFMSC